jgi:nicotinate phosphoribosyltransferase
MIKSILDTDLYKFSTSNAYFQLYPLAEGTFKFNDRNKEDWRGTNILELMEAEFALLGSLSLTNEEKEWCIHAIPYIPENYWEWLSTFRFEPDRIKFYLDEDGVFQCEVTDKMYRVTLYEIAVLATFAEVRNEILQVNVNMDEVNLLLMNKLDIANQKKFSFSEFGTRRRFSSAVQEEVLNTIHYFSKTCAGTSNVYYAMLQNMTPTGTFPHEWMMFHAGVFGYKRANYLGLEDWVKVYDGNLGTALTDTYTTASFLRTLTRKQAHLFSGFRVDSGDEFEIGDMIIDRLEEFGIDATSKLLIFSNALDFEKAAKIFKYFKGRAKVSFGIGTNLTCDTGVEGYKPANIVMKLSRCRMSEKDPWENCIKISDDLGKHMGDQVEFEIAAHELHLNFQQDEGNRFIPV